MTIYLAIVAGKFGWLQSISDSYYHIKHKDMFTFVLWSFATLMLLGVNDIITNLPNWNLLSGYYLQFVT